MTYNVFGGTLNPTLTVSVVVYTVRSVEGKRSGRMVYRPMTACLRWTLKLCSMRKHLRGRTFVFFARACLAMLCSLTEMPVCTFLKLCCNYTLTLFSLLHIVLPGLKYRHRHVIFLFVPALVTF